MLHNRNIMLFPMMKATTLAGGLRMTPSQRLFSGVALVVMTLSPFASAAEISADTLRSPATLSFVQQTEVDAYVQENVAILLKGDDDTMGEARNRLIEPLQKGGSATFSVAYSASVSRELGKALQVDRVQVKLNAMIVVSKLIDSSAINLIKQGLGDGSPACRIWGAKAAYEFAVAGRLTPEDEKGLLKPLEGVLARDQAPEVLEQVLRVMAEFKSDDAVKATLGALNQRLSLFAGDSKLSIRADLEGLRSVYVRMVQARAANQNVRQDALRLLGTVAFRHLTASVRRVDAGKGQPMKADDKKMIDLADHILPWVVKQLNESLTPPGNVLSLAQLDNKIAEALLRVEDWKRFLIAPPLNYVSKELDVIGIE